MAKRPYLEELADQTDRMLINMVGGNLEAELRIARRVAQRRELEQLKQQAKAHAAVPPALLQQSMAATPPRRPKKARNVSPRTTAMVSALVDVAFNAGKLPREAIALARLAKRAAVDRGVGDAESWDSEDGALPELARAVLTGMARD